MLVRSFSLRHFAVPLAFVIGCGGSAEPASSAGQPTPHAAPTFELIAPGEQLSPELNQLLAQLQRDNPNLPEVSAQIASHKHPAATGRAGRKLIDLAKRVAAPAWLESRRGDAVEKNARSGRVASKKEIQAQLQNTQTEALTPIYRAMQNLGGEAVIEHSMGIVRNIAAPPERRALALGVVLMQLPKGDARSDEVTRLSEDIDKKMQAMRSNPVAMREAQETIRKLGVPFQACYDAELAKTPDLEVRGQLVLAIDKDGSVASAKGRDLMPESLNACVERAGRDAKFSARPEQTTMRIPILFKKN